MPDSIVDQFGKPIFGKTADNTFSFGLFGNQINRDINSRDEKQVLKQFKSWLFTCATINGSSVASVPLHLYAVTDSKGEEKSFLHKYKDVSQKQLKYLQGGKNLKAMSKLRRAENVVEIVDHPLLDLLENVNNYNNHFESIELSQIYLDMIGNAYWYVIKDELGVPREIWVLPSQFMTVVADRDPKKFIKGYLFGEKTIEDKNLVKFLPEEIIHFKNPNPNSQFYGKGSAQAVLRAVNRLDKMDISESARLENMGRPDFAVKYNGGKIDSKDLKKIEKAWNNAFGGPGRAGKVKVMDEDWSLDALGFAPKDMEYLSGRVCTLKEIAGAFGIPYSMLDTSDSKKATSELGLYWHSKNAIMPRVKRIEEKLNERLIPMFDDSGKMFIAFEDVVPEDKAAIVEENVAYINVGVKSVNEVRREIGLEPYQDEKFDLPKEESEVVNAV